MSTCALAVMTKAPLVGTSKTRLSPPLSASEAAELSACFLRDTCENIAGVCSDGSSKGVAVYTPAGTEAFFKGLLPASFGLLTQRGNAFGDRLFHAVEDLLSSGHDSLCLINSDSPTLPPSFLRAAVAALATHDDPIVLGAASDGGYYLIGLRKAHRQLFEDVDWSTSRVLSQTIERARELKLALTILPEWFDVDDAASLRQLCNQFFAGNGDYPTAPDIQTYQAPHTRAYLAQLLQTDSGRERFWDPLAGFTEVLTRGTEDAG